MVLIVFINIRYVSEKIYTLDDEEYDVRCGTNYLYQYHRYVSEKRFTLDDEEYDVRCVTHYLYQYHRNVSDNRFTLYDAEYDVGLALVRKIPVKTIL